MKPANQRWLHLARAPFLVIGRGTVVLAPVLSFVFLAGPDGRRGRRVADGRLLLTCASEEACSEEAARMLGHGSPRGALAASFLKGEGRSADGVRSALLFKVSVMGLASTCALPKASVNHSVFGTTESLIPPRPWLYAALYCLYESFLYESQIRAPRTE